MASSRLLKTVIPVSDLQRQTSEIISRVKETGEPVLVTQRGRQAAVLLRAEDYYAMVEEVRRLEETEFRALAALSEADIAAGRVIPHEEVKRIMEEKWAAKGE